MSRLQATGSRLQTSSNNRLTTQNTRLQGTNLRTTTTSTKTNPLQQAGINNNPNGIILTHYLNNTDYQIIKNPDGTINKIQAIPITYTPLRERRAGHYDRSKTSTYSPEVLTFTNGNLTKHETFTTYKPFEQHRGSRSRVETAIRPATKRTWQGNNLVEGYEYTDYKSKDVGHRQKRSVKISRKTNYTTRTQQNFKTPETSYIASSKLQKQREEERKTNNLTKTQKRILEEYQKAKQTGTSTAKIYQKGARYIPTTDVIFSNKAFKRAKQALSETRLGLKPKFKRPITKIANIVPEFQKENTKESLRVKIRDHKPTQQEKQYNQAVQKRINQLTQRMSTPYYMAQLMQKAGGKTNDNNLQSRIQNRLLPTRIDPTTGIPYRNPLSTQEELQKVIRESQINNLIRKRLKELGILEFTKGIQKGVGDKVKLLTIPTIKGFGQTMNIPNYLEELKLGLKKGANSRIQTLTKPKQTYEIPQLTGDFKKDFGLNYKGATSSAPDIQHTANMVSFLALPPVIQTGLLSKMTYDEYKQFKGYLQEHGFKKDTKTGEQIGGLAFDTILTAMSIKHTLQNKRSIRSITSKIVKPQRWTSVKILEKTLPRDKYLQLVRDLKGIQNQEISIRGRNISPSDIVNEVNWNKINKPKEARDALLEVVDKHKKNVNIEGSLTTLSRKRFQEYLTKLEGELKIKIPEKGKITDDLDASVKSAYKATTTQYELDLNKPHTARKILQLMKEKQAKKGFLDTKGKIKGGLNIDWSMFNKEQKVAIQEVAKAGGMLKGSPVLNLVINKLFKEKKINKKIRDETFKDLSKSDVDFSIETMKRWKQRGITEKIQSRIFQELHKHYKAIEASISETGGKSHIKRWELKNGKWEQTTQKIAKPLKFDVNFRLARLVDPKNRNAEPFFDLTYEQGINALKKDFDKFGGKHTILNPKTKKPTGLYAMNINKYIADQINRFGYQTGKINFEKGLDKLQKLEKLGLIKKQAKVLELRKIDAQQVGKEIDLALTKKGIKTKGKFKDDKSSIDIPEGKLADIKDYAKWSNQFDAPSRYIKGKDGYKIMSPWESTKRSAIAHYTRGLPFGKTSKDLLRLELQKGHNEYIANKLRPFTKDKGYLQSQQQKAIQNYLIATGQKIEPLIGQSNTKIMLNKIWNKIQPFNLELTPLTKGFPNAKQYRPIINKGITETVNLPPKKYNNKQVSNLLERVARDKLFQRNKEKDLQTIKKILIETQKEINKQPNKKYTHTQAENIINKTLQKKEIKTIFQKNKENAIKNNKLIKEYYKQYTQKYKKGVYPKATYGKPLDYQTYKQKYNYVPTQYNTNPAYDYPTYGKYEKPYAKYSKEYTTYQKTGYNKYAPYVTNTPYEPTYVKPPTTTKTKGTIKERKIRKKDKKIKAHQPILYDEQGNKRKAGMYATEDDAIEGGMLLTDQTKWNKFYTKQVLTNQQNIQKSPQYRNYYKFQKRGNSYIERRPYRFDTKKERTKNREKESGFKTYSYIFTKD